MVEDFDDAREAAIIEEKKEVRKKLKKVKDADADDLNVTEMKFLPKQSPVLLDGRKSRLINAKGRPRSGKSEMTEASNNNNNDLEERRIRSRNRRKRRQRDEEQQ